MIVEKLRSATRPAHAQLDQQFFPVIQQVKDHEAYVKVLVTFYGFYKPMYVKLDRFLSKVALPLYDERRKPSWLLNDIILFTDHYDLMYCEETPAIRNLYEALGAYYVLEGATMGGEIISKKIVAGLHRNSDTGFSFFNAYGTDNPVMWRKFLSFLENTAFTAEEEAGIIGAAEKTFTAFKHWINLQHERSIEQLQPGM